MRNKAIYLALGVNLQGLKEVLGVRASDNEGSRVLDTGHYRTENARRTGYIYCLRRWTQRFPGSHRSHLPEHADSALYRSSCVVKSWRNNWTRVIPMFSFAPEIRRAIYTTNTIESLNMTLRKVIKNRAMFPSDEAVFKILYLALRNISKRWTSADLPTGAER